MSDSTEANRRDRMHRRVLNPRAAILCVAIMVAMMVTMRQLHSRNFDRTCDFLHQLAEEAIAEGNDGEALACLTEYVAVRPHDPQMKEQLSLLLHDRIATSDALNQAFRINEELLRRDAARTDLRLRHARLAVRLGRHSAAASHLSILRSELPESSEVFHLSGLVASNMRESSEAIEYLKIATELPHPVPDAFCLLATFHANSSSGKAETASLMDQMVQRNPCAQSYALRAAWQLDRGEPVLAVRDVWTGLNLSSADARLLQLLVSCTVELERRSRRSVTAEQFRENWSDAVGHLRVLVESHPLNPTHYLQLARLLQTADQGSDACTVLEDGLRALPGQWQMIFQLAELYLEQGRTADARRLLGELADHREMRSPRQFLEGRILMQERQWADAESALNRVRASPDSSEQLRHRAMYCMALCRQQQGDRHAALDLYRDLASSQQNSDAILLGLASAYWDANQKDLALSVWRRLVHIPEVAGSLADALIQHNQSLPAGARDWNEVKTLLSEKSGRIIDPVERALLQADMQFARGDFTSALELLDQTEISWPDRIEVRRSVRFLRLSSGIDLAQILASEAAVEFDNVSTHVAILRYHLARNDLNQVEGWLRQISSGSGHLAMDQQSAMRLAVECARVAAARERHSGSVRNAERLHEIALRTARQLASEPPHDIVPLIQLLTQTDLDAEVVGAGDAGSGNAEAIALLRSVSALDPDARARGWREFVRFSADRGAAGQLALTEVYALIQQQPVNLNLRAAYAEILLYLERTDEAYQVLKDVEQSGMSHSWSSARLEWIESVRRQPSQDKSSLAGLLPDVPAEAEFRALKARILYEAESYSDALGMADGLPLAAAKTVAAAALVRLERREQARAAANQAELLSWNDPLMPQDERLLQVVMQDLESPSQKPM